MGFVGRGIESTVDPTVLQRVRMRLVARRPDLSDALVVLNRLRQRLALGTPTSLAETRVEQSFNEQLFHRVLGYRTLLSHDKLPFHLRPKTFTGTRWYDDFSLGFFDDTHANVFASAELKDPNCDLDKPQSGGTYANTTPVEQAFRAARDIGGCRWVIVSNFHELRLYSTDKSDSWLARANLTEISTWSDACTLVALFGRDSLLPSDTDVEFGMSNSELDGTAVLPAEAGKFRMVLRLTPKDYAKSPVGRFVIERALSNALLKLDELKVFGRADFGRKLVPPIELSGDWVSATKARTDGETSIRVAISRRMEIELSLAIPTQTVCADGMSEQCVPLLSLSQYAKLLQPIAVSVFGEIEGDANKIAALISAELRDVQGHRFSADTLSALESDSLNWGKFTASTLLAGEFEWLSDDKTSRQSLASVICEFAIYARQHRGGVRLSHQAVQNLLVPVR